MNLSGTVLKGRYCILEPLGKGGGGKVYLARDLELGVLWAVKEIPVSGRNEARMLLKLSHPSLPKMVDYIEDDQKCYLVMEYVKGKSLGEYIRSGERFSIKEIIKYGIEITEIFVYFHNQKPPVYYGDLKPDNLMLGENGRLYLIDLGGAVNGYKYQHKVCTGTNGFAAPEQYEGRINAATDIYTFGKTLSALCQKPDFLLFIQNMSLFCLIFRCCQKKPEMRFQNMETVQKKLSRDEMNNEIACFFIAGTILSVISIWLLPKDYIGTHLYVGLISLAAVVGLLIIGTCSANMKVHLTLLLLGAVVQPVGFFTIGTLMGRGYIVCRDTAVLKQ